MTQTKEVQKTIPAARALVSPLAAIDLLGHAVRRPDETLRAARDKVRKRLNDALANRDLIPTADDQLVFGDVALWARTKKNWRAAVSGWPTTPVEANFATHVVVGSFMEADGLPGNLRECQVDLSKALDKLRVLERENALLRAEVTRARPIVERDTAKKQKLQAAARKKRGPR